MEKIGGRPRFQDESVRASSLVVIAAVPKEFYPGLPLHLLDGKVLVDVSNRNSVKRKTEL